MRCSAALLAAAVLIALAPARVGAQEVTLGLKGGLNVANLSVDDPGGSDSGFDSQADFLAGLFAQFGIGRVFALQPEVLYSQRGAKTRGDDSATKLNLNYVQIPLLLMARLGSRESPIYPILYAGPQIALETRCQVTGEDEGVSVGLDCDDPLLDGELKTNSTEYGVVFGGGFELLYSRLTVQLDLRYQLALTNLNDTADSAEVAVKSRVWSLMLGFGVPLQ
jgi:hypothetical protein